MNGPMRDRLAKLFAMLGSDNAGERENARTLIDEILRKNRKSWNDLTELLQTGSNGTAWNIDDGEAAVATGANISALMLCTTFSKSMSNSNHTSTWRLRCGFCTRMCTANF
jgi:hypothetical protein